MDKANSYVIPNAYPQLIEENGGVGMNAGTGEDSTNYFYNFPAQPPGAVVSAGIAALLRSGVSRVL